MRWQPSGECALRAVCDGGISPRGRIGCKCGVCVRDLVGAVNVTLARSSSVSTVPAYTRELNDTWRTVHARSNRLDHSCLTSACLALAGNHR